MTATSVTVDCATIHRVKLRRSYAAYLVALQGSGKATGGDDSPLSPPWSWMMSSPGSITTKVVELLTRFNGRPDDRPDHDSIRAEDCWSAIAAAVSVDTNESELLDLAGVVTSCQDRKLSYLNQQLLLVELPITLLHRFAGDDRLDAIGQDAVELFGQQVLELLDDDGWPGAEVAGDFGQLAASWTRCVGLLNAIGWFIDDDAARALRWLPRQVMRLLRKDRTLMLSDSAATVSDDFLNSMLRVFGDADDAIIAARTVDRPKKPRPNLVMIDKSRNSISTWGGSLLFHDRWERNGCKLAAAFDAAGCHLEIAKKISLIRGPVFPQLMVDGNPVALLDEPDVLVDYVDGSVAFAEIEWQFENEVVMQRQIILSMDDKFAWIGDAITTAEVAEIDYRCRWKLADGITTVGETENTEGYLYDGKKMRALVIPPGANEWKTSRAPLQVNYQDQHFTITAQRRGRSLYAPVFIDLSPKRCLKARTWRQLTVAENLEIVADDVAVAYRVQVGKKQFVFYRSIAEPANRTFFGENVNTELFLGRLEKNHSMTELVEIE